MLQKTPLAEGKTKKLYRADAVRVVSHDDLTAFDGKKHDRPAGKGRLSNRTTVNHFELLRRFGVPLAYIGPCDEESFYALRCTMIPVEVVVRGKAYGSILKREPALAKGQQFDPPLVEFYLKTNGQSFKGFVLGCDDPLMLVGSDAVHLFRPDLPQSAEGSRIAVLPNEQGLPQRVIETAGMMAHYAAKTFLVLQRTYASYGYDYVDMKVEFGFTEDGTLVLADVIDSDSGRLLFDGEHQDKQAYREGAAIDEVMAKYERVAKLTDGFAGSYQAIEANCEGIVPHFSARFIHDDGSD